MIGVPREIKDHETRVGLVPAAVAALREAHHEVLVEAGAGEGSSIPDAEYTRAGARILQNAGEVWGRADVVMKVKEPQRLEYAYFRPGLILFTYLHLAPLPELTDRLLDARVTGVAYETIRETDGSLPLLTPMSEVAGRMAVQVGAQYLEKPNGGRGILLGGVPGVAPANAVILGGGVVGTNAAKMAMGLGAHVTIIDRNLNRLRELDDIFNGQVVTLASNAWTINENLKDGRPGGGRSADPRRFGAEAGPPRNDRGHEARRGGGGRGHRSGRLFRDLAPHHAYRPGVLRGWRAALLRVQHAGGGAAHFHDGADQRDVSVLAGAGESRTGNGLRAASRAARGRQHLSRAGDASRRGGIAGPRVARNGGSGVSAISGARAARSEYRAA